MVWMIISRTVIVEVHISLTLVTPLAHDLWPPTQLQWSITLTYWVTAWSMVLWRTSSIDFYLFDIWVWSSSELHSKSFDHHSNGKMWSSHTCVVCSGLNCDILQCMSDLGVICVYSESGLFKRLKRAMSILFKIRGYLHVIFLNFVK